MMQAAASNDSIKKITLGDNRRSLILEQACLFSIFLLQVSIKNTAP
ncbi:MAG: hypothetical protein H0U44_10975 [Flavisolibacter sp.]|nr:hypothetical protein [Flavisolibacter sp.]